MMNMLFNILKIFIVTYISIKLISVFNILELFDIIPYDDLYGVCITLYIAIFDTILEHLISLYEKFFKSYIEVIFYKNDQVPSIGSDTIVNFKDDLAEVLIKLKIIGYRKHFKNVRLVIPENSFASMQCGNNNNNVAVVDEFGNYIIDLSELLIESKEKLKVERNFKILFIKEPYNGSGTLEIVPRIEKNNRDLNIFSNIKKQKNKINLKIEE